MHSQVWAPHPVDRYSKPSCNPLKLPAHCVQLPVCCLSQRFCKGLQFALVSPSSILAVRFDFLRATLIAPAKAESVDGFGQLLQASLKPGDCGGDASKDIETVTNLPQQYTTVVWRGW